MLSSNSNKRATNDYSHDEYTNKHAVHTVNNHHVHNGVLNKRLLDAGLVDEDAFKGGIRGSVHKRTDNMRNVIRGREGTIIGSLGTFGNIATR